MSSLNDATVASTLSALASRTALACSFVTSMSLIVGVTLPSDAALIPNAARLTTTIATSDDGTARVNFGRPQMMSIVTATSPNITVNGIPPMYCSRPSSPSTLKLPSCAMPMTIARPLTKPSITLAGTMRMSMPSFSSPTIT